MNCAMQCETPDFVHSLALAALWTSAYTRRRFCGLSEVKQRELFHFGNLVARADIAAHDA